jgi:hypothetical protein
VTAISGTAGVACGHAGTAAALNSKNRTNDLVALMPE